MERTKGWPWVQSGAPLPNMEWSGRELAFPSVTRLACASRAPDDRLRPAAHSCVYEVTEPSSSDMKGGRHTSCPFGCVGRGRVGLVTDRLNLPRHGTAKGSAEKAGSRPSQGCQPNPQAVA